MFQIFFSFCCDFVPKTRTHEHIHATQYSPLDQSRYYAVRSVFLNGLLAFAKCVNVISVQQNLMCNIQLEALLVYLSPPNVIF